MISRQKHIQYPRERVHSYKHTCAHIHNIHIQTYARGAQAPAVLCLLFMSAWRERPKCQHADRAGVGKTRPPTRRGQTTAATASARRAEAKATEEAKRKGKGKGGVLIESLGSTASRLRQNLLFDPLPSTLQHATEPGLRRALCPRTQRLGFLQVPTYQPTDRPTTVEIRNERSRWGQSGGWGGGVVPRGRSGVNGRCLKHLHTDYTHNIESPLTLCGLYPERTLFNA